MDSGKPLTEPNIFFENAHDLMKQKYMSHLVIIHPLNPTIGRDGIWMNIQPGFENASGENAYAISMLR